MNVNVSFKDNSMILEYTANQEEIEILKNIKENGYIEFRSSRYIDDSEEQINFNLCQSLESNGFLFNDLDAWHTTYNLTARGERFINYILSK